MPKYALTDDDIKLLNETFATKDQHNELKNLVEHLPTKTEFYKAMDQVVGELKSMREELAMVAGHKDTLIDHEERITVLETKVNTSAN